MSCLTIMTSIWMSNPISQYSLSKWNYKKSVLLQLNILSLVVEKIQLLLPAALYAQTERYSAILTAASGLQKLETLVHVFSCT